MTNTRVRAIDIDAVVALLRGEPVAWRTLGVSQAAFADVCGSEQLFGLVHRALNERGGAEAGRWPEPLAREVAARARADSAREAVRRAELAELLGAFAANGLRPTLFKGTALAYGVYDSPGLRPRLDTDILVARGDVPATVHVLAERGYAVPAHSGADVVLCQLTASKTDALGIEHVVDVHWKVSVHPTFADLVTCEELAAGSVTLPALGPHARAAGRLHALLLACVHPVMHHRGIERLLWLYDIHLLAGQLSRHEFETFAALARARRVGRICAREISRARQRFRTPLAPDLEAQLTAGGAEPSAAFLRSGRRWHHETASALRDLPHWRDRLRLAREVLLPDPRYMLSIYPVSSRAVGLALLPALYVHRNVRGVWKVLAGRK